MEALVKSQESMVNSNEFEKLLERIEEENAVLQEKNAAIKLIDEKLRSIQKSIMSVYYFLRIKCNMPARALSLEEYAIAENKLRELAQNEVKKTRRRFWRSFGIKSAWDYFLEKGFFGPAQTPFGNWGLSGYLGGRPFNSCLKSVWDTFLQDELKKKIAEFGCGPGGYYYTVPPNIFELSDALYRERNALENKTEKALNHAGSGTEEK